MVPSVRRCGCRLHSRSIRCGGTSTLGSRRAALPLRLPAAVRRRSDGGGAGGAGRGGRRIRRVVQLRPPRVQPLGAGTVGPGRQLHEPDPPVPAGDQQRLPPAGGPGSGGRQPRPALRRSPRAGSGRRTRGAGVRRRRHRLRCTGRAQGPARRVGGDPPPAPGWRIRELRRRSLPPGGGNHPASRPGAPAHPGRRQRPDGPGLGGGPSRHHRPDHVGSHPARWPAPRGSLGARAARRHGGLDRRSRRGGPGGTGAQRARPSCGGHRRPAGGGGAAGEGDRRSPGRRPRSAPRSWPWAATTRSPPTC